MSDSPISKVESRSKFDPVFTLAFLLNILGLLALSVYYLITVGPSNFLSGKVLLKHILLALDVKGENIDELLSMDLDVIVNTLIPINLMSIVFMVPSLHASYRYPKLSFWISIGCFILCLFSFSVIAALAQNYVLFLIWFVLFVASLFLCTKYRKNYPKVAFFFKSTLFVCYKVRWMLLLNYLADSS